MCGRYLRRSDKQRIAEAFHLGRLPENFILPPDFNIAPATFQPVIRLHRDTGEREIVMMRWGLVPYFARSAAEFKGFSTINAKAETVARNGMWKAPFAKRRCLVPADGFYEWLKVEPTPGSRGKPQKKPFAYTLRNDEPFAFAGLWDAWKDPVTGDWLQTFAIITTEANELTGEVHDRMPVILQPRDYNRWLERGEAQTPPLDLLRPYPAEGMTACPANAAVGNVRNNGPEMLQSAEAPNLPGPPEQARLLTTSPETRVADDRPDASW
jgi:putative SOS response-associated peptidase YedK